MKIKSKHPLLSVLEAIDNVIMVIALFTVLNKKCLKQLYFINTNMKLHMDSVDYLNCSSASKEDTVVIEVTRHTIFLILCVPFGAYSSINAIA